MAGRPRKPSKVLEMQGAFDKNPQRRRTAEPKPRGDLGKAPGHLPPNVAAVWDEIASISPPGVFGDSDRLSVEVACNLIAEMREDPRDFSASRLAQLRGLLGQFGMTPADRSKVIIDNPDDQADPWDDL